MKASLRLACSVGLLVFTACDTPWAAAERNRQGISWEDWQRGVRTRQQLEEERSNAAAVRQNAVDLEVQQERERRRQYLVTNPDLPNHVAQAIAEAKLAVGMTPDQVRLVWDKPKSINSSNGAWGEREQWVYGGGRYAYLLNGRLESWQISQ